MSVACHEFRARLAQLLSGGGDAPALGELAWHEHLLACAECRELLDSEQALEQLLASLPRPQLPPELAARVLARLDPHRGTEAALDRLLELPAVEVPSGLAANVLARLEQARVAARRERALDRVLNCAPVPEVPAKLGQHVLAKLRFERERTTRRPVAARPHADAPRSSRTRVLALAAALAVALGVAAWWFATRPSPIEREVANAPSESPRIAPSPVAVGEASSDEPSAELLAALDLLESWDVVASEDLDVQLNALDALDELLLSSDVEASASEPAPNASESSPSKG